MRLSPSSRSALSPSGQMVYNYLRFDNPLDFGIQYSLTINDFTHSEFHWKYVLINMYAYLLNMPHFTPKTFHASCFLRRAFRAQRLYVLRRRWQESYIRRNHIPRSAHVRLSLLGQGIAARREEKSVLPILLIGVTCILMPLAIIFSSWESGYAVRYNADFSWQMVIGALVIAFTLYKSIKSESAKKLVDLIFTVSTVACIYVNMAQLISFTGVEGASG